jgi:HK97 family phage major capsid protein
VNLKEIAERRAAIQAEVETPDLPIERLEELKTEVEKLNDEERALLVEAEKREELIKATLAGKGEVITEQKLDERKENKPMEIREIAALPEYRTGWLKKHMGVELTEEEARSVALANAGAVVPVETSQKIYDIIKQKGNLLNKIDLYRVNGYVQIPVQGTNTAPELHTENAALNAAPDTWTTITLNAYEITKLVRLSKSLMKMSIDAFESKLAEKIAEAIVIKAESYILYGTGSGQPKGIDKAQSWSDGTNGVDWAGAAPTAAELIELASYFPGGHYSNAHWIMNHKTFFNRVYALRDDAKFPLAKEVGDGWVILGRPVILCDSAADDDIYLADLSAVVGNLSEDIAVERSDASGFAYNAVDFRGSCIFDCDIAVPTAFVKSEATLA